MAGGTPLPQWYYNNLTATAPRFDKDVSQWKERGLGDISVMWNKREGKGRVLMRREQILKLCCNHQITKEMELKPHQGTATRGYLPVF